MIKIFRIIICLVILTNSFSAQNAITDSLKKIALRVDKDSASKLYVKIANVFTGVNSDSVRKYAQIASNMAPPNSIAKGDVLVQFGNSYHMENKVDSALKYYNKALIYFQKIGNDKGIGKVYQSFSLVKRTNGDLEGAIADNKKALEIYEKINWTLGLVNINNNISNLYIDLKKTDLALIHSRKAFALSLALNDSIKYFNMMMQLGVRFNDAAKYDSSLIYLKGPLSFFERNGFNNYLLILNSNLANVYWKLNKNTTQTKHYLYKSLEYSNLAGTTDNIKHIYRDLAMCYIFEKKTDSAEVYFFKTLAINDSINFQKGLEVTKELETKYETEKKELQITNQTFEIEAKEKQNQQKSLIILFGTLALLGTGFFAVMAFINFRKAKKANLIIENQKMEVELKNEEITHQKDLVDEKQKEIIDSINYAKRIQQAVLTGEDVWNKISKEYFILFYLNLKIL
jgi:tetratricopeptide (TPR) repeat protein